MPIFLFDKFAAIPGDGQGQLRSNSFERQHRAYELFLLCLATPTTKTANSGSSSETTIRRRRGVPEPTSPSGSWPGTKKCTNSDLRCGPVQHRPLRLRRQRKKTAHFPPNNSNLSRSASISVKMRSGDLHMVSTRLITSAFLPFCGLLLPPCAFQSETRVLFQVHVHALVLLHVHVPLVSSSSLGI